MPAAGSAATGAPAPLVVTLTLDGASQECFDSLRRTHFPADRNHLGAHVTLFHAPPGGVWTPASRVGGGTGGGGRGV